MALRKRYRPSAGDIWRGTSMDGFVYFQVAGPEVPRPFPSTFVRALPGVYPLPLQHNDLSSLARGREQFIIRYPVARFASLPRFHHEGRFHLPENFEYPPPMRTTTLHRRLSKIWDADGEELSPEEFLARHPGADLADVAMPLLPFHGLLINMARAGWTPRMQDDDPKWLDKLLEREEGGEQEDRTSHEEHGGRERDAELSTTHYLVFDSRSDASTAVGEAKRAMADLHVVVSEPVDVGGHWSISVTVPGLPQLRHRELLEELANMRGGAYDGDEVGPLN